MQYGTYQVKRPNTPDPVTHKIDGLYVVLQPNGAQNISGRVQPLSYQQTLEIQGAVQGKTFKFFFDQVPIVDVRLQDRLVELSTDVDPLTQQPREYIVAGVRPWQDHHVEVIARLEAK